MTEFDLDRRTALMAGGTALIAGLAGCVGGDGDGDSSGNGGDNGSDTDPQQQVDTYLSDNNANNYDGTGSIVDETGTDELLIEVGRNRQYQYDPAAVRIDSGTTITWEWKSNGHSVTQTESDFDFEDSGRQSSGSTHEQTLNSSGAFLYKCIPHANLGHYGGIIVE
ncbi:MAG: halocyanin domain protein [halophilic archaeon J07HX64]|jgi:halocyanin domain|nr:MAG: halocyanin domain protein [halophilic archaeon J07HX64]